VPAPDPCESAQLALLEGSREPWALAHAAECEECRFFKDLSRELAASSRIETSAAGTDLGTGFEAILAQAAQTGTAVSRYRPERLLGRGGQGVVYQALDTETRETVAIKLIRCRPGRVETSATEVALAHLVRHPGVCRVYHTERHGEVRLIVMELLEGKPLDQAAAAGLLPRARLKVFRGICEAVHAAHEAGVLHLDLKPTNVILRGSGEPVVTDFGLASRFSDAPPARRGGTPGYMAPEQRDGRPLDRRTDVHALGVLLQDLFPQPSRRLARLIGRAAASDPSARFPDVRALLQALDRPSRLRAKAWRLSLAALAAAAVVGLGMRSPWGSPPTGDALLLGGTGGDGVWNASAEIFDAEQWVWRPVGPVPDPGRSAPRLCQARAVRAGSEVLVLGGGAAGGCQDDSSTTNRVRILSIPSLTWAVPRCQDPCIEYEGATYRLDAAQTDFARQWTKALCNAGGPCMAYGRNNFVALTLPSEDIFVFGGCAGGCSGPNELLQTLGRPAPLARTVEIYRRAAGTWQAQPPSLLPRAGARAVAVGPNVLVCGGDDGFDRVHDPAPDDTCEWFDLNATAGGAPAWKPAGKMPSASPPMLAVLARYGILGVQPGHAWTWRQKDPRELSAWRWDSSFFTPLPAPPRGHESATLTGLKDGRVLLVGGRRGDSAMATAHVFVPAPDGLTGVWQDVAPMRGARFGHSATLLRDGRVLVAGGCSPAQAASEVYDPVSNTWSDAGQMSTPRCSPQAVGLR
jgi:predicted Ser/Thr protein kinase